LNISSCSSKNIKSNHHQPCQMKHVEGKVCRVVSFSLIIFLLPIENSVSSFYISWFLIDTYIHRRTVKRECGCTLVLHFVFY
jgi:hypothetical protein